MARIGDVRSTVLDARLCFSFSHFSIWYLHAYVYSRCVPLFVITLQRALSNGRGGKCRMHASPVQSLASVDYLRLVFLIIAYRRTLAAMGGKQAKEDCTVLTDKRKF